MNKLNDLKGFSVGGLQNGQENGGFSSVPLFHYYKLTNMLTVLLTVTAKEETVSVPKDCHNFQLFPNLRCTFELFGLNIFL